MPRFAANLTMLFTELPMLERFAAAADAGFQGVEILFPYDIPARDLSRAAIAAGLEFVLMNTPPPNWAGGPRGFAAEPGREDRFRSDFDRALRFAEALRARHVHIMAGYAEGPDARATFTRNLAWAADRAPHVSLMIEPLNPMDQPGYFLADFDLAAEIIAQVGAPNLGLQFDSYHAQACGHRPPCPDRGRSRTSRTDGRDDRLSGLFRRPGSIGLQGLGQRGIQSPRLDRAGSGLVATDLKRSALTMEPDADQTVKGSIAQGGTGPAASTQGYRHGSQHKGAVAMNSIIYIVGLVVVVLFILSFLGLR